MKSLLTGIIVCFFFSLLYPCLSTANGKIEQRSPLEYQKYGSPGEIVFFSVDVQNLGLTTVSFYPGLILNSQDSVYELYPSTIEILQIPPDEIDQIEFSVNLPDNEGVYFATVFLFDYFSDEILLVTNDISMISIGNTDMDNDGLLDIWENLHGLDTSIDDTDNDGDNDGLTNIQEYQLGTFPFFTDTDLDGLSDYFEIAFDGDDLSYNIYTDLSPVNLDTDFDYLSDFFEVSFDNDSESFNSFTDINPLMRDTDNDGLLDGFEVTSAFETDEKQINTYSAASQWYSSVAASDSNYLVVWYDDSLDGNQSGIFGQYYDFNGNNVGEEFQVNTYTVSHQYMPAVTSDGTNYMVVWQSYYQDGDEIGVFGQLFSSQGNKIGAEFQVNTYTTSEQWLPAAASNGTNYLVVWQSQNQDGSGKGVFGQFYDSAGNAFNSEFQVNSYTTDYQAIPAVASNGTNYMVVWEGSEESGTGIFARVYDQNGNPSGIEFKVNEYTSGFQQSPCVSSDGKNYFISWESQDQDGDLYGIIGRLFDSSCNPLTSEFQINTYTTEGQSNSSITSNGAVYLLTWQSNGQDGNDEGVFGRFYDPMGNRIGGEFQLNEFILSLQGVHSAASCDNGFCVTWTSFFQDGSWGGVFGKFFKISDPLNVDTDNDGMNDFDEVYAGMDPSNSDSLFTLIDIQIDYLPLPPPLAIEVKITWQATTKLNKIYKIFWKDDFSLDWDQIDYSGWENDIIDNGDGTKSWIDQGWDNEMTYGPNNTKSRVYKVIVEDNSF